MEPVEKRLDRFRYVRAAELIIDFRRDAFCCAIDSPTHWQGHILVCFLAFVLWKSLEMWQSRAGLGNSPSIILEELKRIYFSFWLLKTTSLFRASL
jgi:hypothetical protein